MKPLILLTGSTGYIGGRLLKALEKRGANLRCMARNPAALAGRTNEGVQVVKADVLEPASLLGALENVHTAYYLVHSMGSSGNFEEEDLVAAKNFTEAARKAGTKRIIYLGGLGNSDDGLSKHLISRQQVGEALRQGGVPVIEFRASIIIGSGSLSFEMIRALVERLPVMITPRWVTTMAQPIGITDVIDYLVLAADLETGPSMIYEIGGPDTVSYGELMQEYARQRGLRRLTIPVPFLTPHLSSLWLALVTPIYARVGKKLVDSLRCPTLVTDTTAQRTFSIRPKGVVESIRSALANEDQDFAQTRWCDALSSGSRPAQYGGVRFGSRLVDSRSTVLKVTPHQAFDPIRRIGGSRGWYFGNWLWRLRGLIDLWIGGVGIRRGRKHDYYLYPGDTLDCWRVETVEDNHLLRLSAEMKLPGRAWLEFEVKDLGEGKTEIRQTALFDPRGLSGLLYWYVIYPLHAVVFRGMFYGIIRAARRSRTALLKGDERNPLTGS